MQYIESKIWKLPSVIYGR